MAQIHSVTEFTLSYIGVDSPDYPCIIDTIPTHIKEIIMTLANKSIDQIVNEEIFHRCDGRVNLATMVSRVLELSCDNDTKMNVMLAALDSVDLERQENGEWELA
jgi:hypothetical protein